MDHLSKLFLLSSNNIALSVPVILLALIAGFVASTISKERPWRGYTLISLDDEKGLGAKASWISHGRELLAKGLKQVRLPTTKSKGHRTQVKRWSRRLGVFRS